MAKVNPCLLPQCCQPSVISIKELVFFYIALRLQPFFLKFSPYCFCNIQMWRVWRKIRNEKSTFFPKKNFLSNSTGFMYTGIILNQCGLLYYIERNKNQEINDNIGINTPLCHHAHIFTLPVDKSQYIDFVSLLNRDMYIFSKELPTIRNISLGAYMKFISIVEVNLPGLTQKFKFRDNLNLMLIILFVWFTFGAGSYPFISSMSTFKKRCKVLSLIDFPRLASHSALATCRCRCGLTASNKLSLSSEFKISLRPWPGLICRLEIPSDLKRAIQWFTLIWLIPFIDPTSLEPRPSTLSRMTWQRVRKQWLVFSQKPYSKARRSSGDNCGIFTRPMCTEKHTYIGLTFT